MRASLRSMSVRRSQVSQLHQAEEGQPPPGRVLRGGGSEQPSSVTQAKPAVPDGSPAETAWPPGDGRTGRAPRLWLLEVTLRTVSNSLALGKWLTPTFKTLRL